MVTARREHKMKKSGVSARAIARAPMSLSRPRERGLLEIAIATCLLAARAASADQATDTTMANSSGNPDGQKNKRSVCQSKTKQERLGREIHR